MKLAKYFLLLFLFVFTLLLNAQENDCNNFLKYFESKEYEKAISALYDCKNIDSLSDDNLIVLDYYLQLCYYHTGNSINYNSYKLESYVNSTLLKDNEIVVGGYFVLLDEYLSKFDYNKASEFALKIDDVTKVHYGEKSIVYAQILAGLGYVYLNSEELKTSIVFYEKALDVVLALPENYDDFVSDILVYLSEVNSKIGNYHKSVDYLNLLLEKIEVKYGNHHNNYAVFLSKLAANYFSLGNYSLSAETEKEVLNIREHLFGNKHLEYAKSLSNLSICHSLLADYSKAIELEETALKIYEEKKGVKHIDYARSLKSLANYHSKLGEYQIAIDLGQQSVLVFEESVGEFNSDYAGSLGNLALYHSLIGDYSKAIEIEKRVLLIRKEVLGEINSEYALSVSNLSGYYFSLGDCEKAILLAEQALHIYKEVLGVNDPSYARVLRNLGECYSCLGKYSIAIEFGEQALGIYKQNFGEDHLYYVGQLNNLSTYHSYLGNYKTAIEFAELALNIYRQKLGDNHPDYITVISNLAGYYFSLGDYHVAVEFGQNSSEIYKQKLGEHHPHYARSLNNLSLYFSQLGDYYKAIELSEQALDIYQHSLGDHHPDFALPLSNLAFYYSELGDHHKAIEFGIQSLDIYQQQLGDKHFHYARTLNNLATCYSDLDDYDTAIEYSEKVLDVFGEIFGQNHPNYVLTLENLGSYYFLLNDFMQSAKYKSEAFYKNNKHIQTQFNWLIEKQRQLYWNTQSSLFLFIPYFAYQSNNSSFIDLSYDGALLSKALMLNSSIELNNLLMESGDEEVIEKAEGLRTIQYTLNRLYEKPISERFLDTDSLEIVAQNLERDLLKLSKEYGDYTKFMSITWQDVQKGLSENDVAIEFVEFPVLKSDSTMYAALVLRKDWEGPQMIPLFEKREIEQYMTQSSDKQYSGFVGKQLYKLMWKPLEEVVQKGDAVHFSAAGIYHQLALEYLPSEDGTPLCDIYNFRRLSSTRQLAIKEKNTTFESATLYGGIQYDVNPTDMLVESKKYQEKETLYSYRGMALNSLRGGSWVPLDNTVKEVVFIANELATNQIETALFTGVNANEESIKALSGKKTNILHLATHGFFLPIEETRKVNYYQMIGTNDHPTPDMSMRRSGLIMAGGNRAWIGDTIPQGIDDGVLTAQEISVLDFREMDLVVLSACETGLGDIDTSEGVFGLQRAFKKAGAKTLIMSLWKVNDEVTKSLMNKFYKSLLSGKTKHDAFLEAQQFIRFRHPEPQNWAAFIMLD